VPGQVERQRGRQHRDAVSVAFPAADGDLVPGEIHVLHAEAEGLQQTQARAVQQQDQRGAPGRQGCR
jgi:hypothetical protein